MAERRELLQRLGLLGLRSALIVAVLVAAVAALHRLDLRFDLSADNRFSLSPELLAIVDDLEQDVEIVSLWTEEAGHQGSLTQADFLGQRLERIADRSPRLVYRHIDSVLDQPALARFTERHGEVAAPALFVIGNGPPFRIPISRVLPHILQREIGGALITVSQRERPPLYLLQGHGELSFAVGGEEGVGALLRRLELAGFAFDAATTVIDEGTLAKKPSIPHGGVLLVPGPTRPLGERAAQALAEYLRDGGAALVLLDHRAPEDLVALLQPWGFQIARFPGERGGFVPVVLRSARFSLDQGDADLTRLQLVPELNIPDNALTAQARGRNQAIISPRTTPLRFTDWHTLLMVSQAQAGAPPVPPEVVAWQTPAVDAVDQPGDGVLLHVPSRTAWLAPVGDREPQPTRGEDLFPIAWAVPFQAHPESANPTAGARIAIWGSRQAGADPWVGSPIYANDVLLGDMAAFLIDRGAATPIPRQQFAQYQVEASDDALKLVLALLVAFIPCLCIGLAILTWWDRR